MIKAVSFYTNDSYKKHAARLEESLKGENIPFEIAPLPDQKTWEENVRQKPSFVHRMLTDSDSDILWLDADSVLRGSPTIFIDGKDFDFAAYRPTPYVFWGGTLFFRNNPKARHVAARWVQLTSDHPRESEDRTLSMAVYEARDLVVRTLPVEYCWVEKWAKDVWPLKVPVIEQFAVGHPLGVQRW